MGFVGEEVVHILGGARNSLTYGEHHLEPLLLGIGLQFGHLAVSVLLLGGNAGVESCLQNQKVMLQKFFLNPIHQAFY